MYEYREVEGDVEAFEAMCESMFDPDYSLNFAGVNGGEDPFESEVA